LGQTERRCDGLGVGRQTRPSREGERAARLTRNLLPTTLPATEDPGRVPDAVVAALHVVAVHGAVGPGPVVAETPSLPVTDSAETRKVVEQDQARQAFRTNQVKWDIGVLCAEYVRDEGCCSQRSVRRPWGNGTEAPASVGVRKREASVRHANLPVQQIVPAGYLMFTW
jgi:hypothetical protein